VALVYGVSEATKEFLKKLPKEVESLDDIKKEHIIMKYILYFENNRYEYELNPLSP